MFTCTYKTLILDLLNNNEEKKMITVTYSNYSKILKKEFINEKEVKNMDDFRLFALSLNLDYKIINAK